MSQENVENLHAWAEAWGMYAGGGALRGRSSFRDPTEALQAADLSE